MMRVDGQSGELGGAFGRLALGVVKVSRHRDDRPGDGRLKGVFGDFPETGKDERREFPRAR